MDADGWCDCAAAGDRHGQVVRIEGEGGGAGSGFRHSDRAIGAVRVAAPAGEGEASVWDRSQGDHGAVGVVFGAIRAAVNANRGAGDGTAADCADAQGLRRCKRGETPGRAGGGGSAIRYFHVPLIFSLLG